MTYRCFLNFRTGVFNTRMILLGGSVAPYVTWVVNQNSSHAFSQSEQQESMWVLTSERRFCLVPSANMAATRLFWRTSGVKSSLTGLTGGVHSSLGLTLLKLYPDCTAKPKTQRRHAAHFTFHPDPVTTQYGKCPCLHFTVALQYRQDSELFMWFTSKSSHH